MAERLRRMFMNDPNFYNPEMMGQDSHFGKIKGIEPGATFVDRQACAQAGVHPRNYAGIAGSPKDGAYSVCLSSGYEDDQDDGEFFVYTGTGGQEDSFSAPGKQTHDQAFEHRDNAALYVISFERERPVRVVRGRNKLSEWATKDGYRYDGLYLVEKAYYDKGKSGFQVCKFELRRLPGQPPIPRNPDFTTKM